MLHSLSALSQMPQKLEQTRGRLEDENGHLLTDNEAALILPRNLYQDTYIGATKQFKIGWNIEKSGIIVSGVGTGILAASGISFLLNSQKGYVRCNDGNIYYGGLVYRDISKAPITQGIFTCGAIVTGVGLVLLGVGIPLHCIGRSRLYWVADQYNGTGLALQF